MQKFKLIVDVGQLPLNTLCTKPGGEKVYRIESTLRVYDEQGSVRMIDAERGTRFLIGSDRNITAISDDKPVGVTGTAQELINLLATLLPRR